ncbi:MAG: SIS domain-containing protein [Verrucomicrobia bacterium]|nr:SIS domain-containing protein [Verrucomicrobiota bacterium]
MSELYQNIMDEPAELIKSLHYMVIDNRATLIEAAAIVKNAAHVFITGIGSSWHAGMAIEGIFNAAGRPVHLVDASELLHFVDIPDDAVLIMLSRSGKSVEIVALVAKAQASGIPIIAVTNTPESPLGKAADKVLFLNAAFDKNVSITMYSALTLVGGLLASESLGLLNENLHEGIARALDEAQSALPVWKQALRDNPFFAQQNPVYFLARGSSLSSCHEARLLWEEAVKFPAAAMMTGCFRHGPQEILHENVNVALWIDQKKMRAHDLALAGDIKAQGRSVMVIGHNIPADAGDLVFNLPSSPTGWGFLVDCIPAQLAAEHMAGVRGVNCDEFLICPYIIESEGGLVGKEGDRTGKLQ